jgi:F-type H+-transporting ATPase subunit delta
VTSETGHETGLAGRYANAVFELAQETNAVDALAADFASLKSMIAASPDFANLVKSPVIPSDTKARAMKALLEKMGAAPLTIQFLLFLIQKRRLFVLGGIIGAYGRLVARLKGEVSAEVISARPLSDSETAELKTVLKNKLGREPRLETSVDPTLLGGLVVKLGSRMIDSSIRTKLTGIRAAMRGN